MAESIYHRNEQGRLEPMQEEQFALEDTLQELIADYPELLSGEQINPDKPRRWILIRREQGIPDIEGGSDRWALDHLLIDQEAIPTLVEVKRSANSEIRCTIVGQMLDYAAHATRTWNIADIRRSFEESSENPERALTDLLQSDSEPDADEFWQQVETNLRAARLRLLFVADGIPDELTRVVEFLNEQMPGIEVLAVEIKQFKGATGQTLVPRVIGRTAATSPSRSSGPRARVDMDEFLSQMPTPQVKEAVQRLLEVASSHGATVFRGSSGISIRCRTPAWQSPVTVAWIYPIPGRSSWVPTRDFTFGAGNQNPNFFENLPENLSELLESWAAQFEGHPGGTDISTTGLKAWAITHEAAAANINVLTERLAKVLQTLRQLEAVEE